MPIKIEGNNSFGHWLKKKQLLLPDPHSEQKNKSSLDNYEFYTNESKWLQQHEVKGVYFFQYLMVANWCPIWLVPNSQMLVLIAQNKSEVLFNLVGLRHMHFSPTFSENKPHLQNIKVPLSAYTWWPFFHKCKFTNIYYCRKSQYLSCYGCN